ncbi:helix-turn-helix domain-containing protein, partial [Mitsuokella jalaludinii]|uniref:helix-turn-helix domain-containing protein n=3 Tax=Mitsuokella jalaludinii TaxID=187979 RepID=UPI003C6CCF30
NPMNPCLIRVSGVRSLSNNKWIRQKDQQDTTKGNPLSKRAACRLHTATGGFMMKSLQEFKAKRMKDPAFAKAYAESEPEINIIRAIVEARNRQNLTQKELAEKTGIAQTEISRIESGARNPSLKILQRLADGMGMVLKVSFEPKREIHA